MRNFCAAYIDGAGGSRDRQLAAYWLRKAAKSEDETADQSALDVLRKNNLIE